MFIYNNDNKNVFFYNKITEVEKNEAFFDKVMIMQIIIIIILIIVVTIVGYIIGKLFRKKNKKIAEEMESECNSSLFKDNY